MVAALCKFSSTILDGMNLERPICIFFPVIQVDFGQFHEALQCPKCPDLFVESLWSLIAHVNCSHSELCSTFLNFKTLQGCKKIVSKSKVCVIRPAFKEDGSRNDFLNFGPDGNFISLESSPNFNLSTSLDSELTEASQNAVTAFSQALAMISDDSNQTEKLMEDSEDGSSPGLLNGGNKRVKRQLPYSRNTKKQICTTCGEIFDNRCLLTLHMMDHKKKTHPFQCPITGCFQCYDSRSKFKSHLTRVHRELTTEQLEILLNGGKLQINPSESNSIQNQSFSDSEQSSPKSKTELFVVEKNIKKEIME